MKTPADDAPIVRKKINMGGNRGGYRPGGGRPPGAISKMSREAREKAASSGMLPHEFLLAITRGERITRWVPHPNPELAEQGKLVQVEEKYTFDDRKDAAKAAAPYFAPRISAVEVIKGTPDNELDAIIAKLAAEAGVDLGALGAGAPPEDDAN